MDSGALGKTVVLFPRAFVFLFFHHFCAPCFGTLGSCLGRPSLDRALCFGGIMGDKLYAVFDVQAVRRITKHLLNALRPIIVCLQLAFSGV
jgi:hypothetical protein